MEKILRIRYGTHETDPKFIGTVVNKDNRLQNRVFSVFPVEIKEYFGEEIYFKIEDFYANPSNRDKNYNLILATDEELSKLEKEATQ